MAESLQTPGKHTTMTRFSRSLVALALAGFAAFAAAQSNDLPEISKLLRSGQHALALERINQYLAGKPKDAQGRFLKGLILTEQNKAAEAIEILTGLTKDYPELPEPYNNLAVLYASQGQYEKARQSLELSIRTHPSYATAYENLGDVYTKLASQAYDKALQLDSGNTTAQTKLALVRDLVSSGARPPKPGATVVASTRAPESAKAAPPVVIAQAAPKAAPAAPAAAPEPKAAAPKPAPAAEAKSVDGGSEEVLKTVTSWAKAWSAKDAGAYLAFYGHDFKTPNGEARTAWEAERRRRIAAPKSIEVLLESPKASVNGNSATVSFRQSYRSDTLKVSSAKTLVLVRSNGKWLIQQERSGS
jgi:tetratricopeptide (TPR) repeat protein